MIYYEETTNLCSLWYNNDDGDLYSYPEVYLYGDDTTHISGCCDIIGDESCEDCYILIQWDGDGELFLELIIFIDTASLPTWKADTANLSTVTNFYFPVINMPSTTVITNDSVVFLKGIIFEDGSVQTSAAAGMLLDEAKSSLYITGDNQSKDAIYSTIIGYKAGDKIEEGDASNTLIGAYTGYHWSGGDYNVAVGGNSLFNATLSDGNTVVGYNSAYNASGSYGVHIGYNCGEIILVMIMYT
jgi:hypothetical protein